MIQKYALICLAFFAFVASGFGQVTIFNETIGTCCGTTNTSIAATTFDNGTLTFTGTADTRTSTGSTGYTGASGGRNVFFTNATGRFFQISGINTTAYTGLTLSFGHIKSTTASNNELVVEVSSDGTNYTPLSYSRATGTGTANIWALITPTGTIPSTANLRIRFTQTSATPQFRIDDIHLVGTLAAGCNITSTGLTALSCDDNGTDTDPLDDFITFDLDPAGSDLGTTYSVSVSGGGTITPLTGTYGGATTFTLQDGSAGAGNVTVTITDDADTGCELDVVITDPGSCSTGGVSVCLEEDFSGFSLPSGWLSSGAGITFGAGYADMSVNTGTLTTIAVSNPTLLTFDLSRTNNATAKNLNIEVSTTNQSSGFSVITNYDHSNTANNGTTACTVDLSAYINESVVYIRFNKTSGSTSPWRIDNIEVTCGPPCTPPADPTGTIAGDTPECESTLLTYSAPNANLYWQDAPDGTSTANPTTTTYEVFTSGTYYVRTFDGTCWSDNTVSYTVVINQLAIINTQPNSQTAVVGENVTYTVTATNASSYQWQQSTDGIVWTNVGIDNASYTINNVTLSLNGYRYRVIVSSSNCGTVTSNIVTLNVFESACIDEDFVDITGWTNSGTTTWNDIAHYGNAAPCRAFGNGSSMITPAVDNPEFLQFFQDASGGGNGNTATVQYRIGAGAWQPLYSFIVTTAGNTETVNLTNIAGVNLSNETNVTFRFNSTFNTWYLDDVKVFCTTCTAPTTTTTISPTSGPVGTEVTISGSDFEATTEVRFNGILATIVSQTPTEIVVIVPNGATDGNIVVSKTSIPVICDSIIPFDVIDDNSSSCQSTFNGTDLFIYEIFDEDNDAVGFANGGMITIFNPTFESVNLSNYRIYRSSNYNTQPYQSWFSPSGTLAPGELYRIRIFGGISSSVCTTYEAPFNDTPIGFNADDGFELRKLDASSTYVSIDQALTPSYVGYYMLRDLNATIPSPTFNATDWTITNIYDPPFNTTTCVNVGVTPTFEGGLPIINSLTNPASVCDVASITINATEGYNETSPADARQLNFEWYYNDGISNSWTLITSGGDYLITNIIDDVAGTGSSTLDVSNVINKVDYQFYCRVRENDASCFTPSNAIKLNVDATTWAFGAWSDGIPNINRIAIIDDNYNTNAGGEQISFSACNLLVRTGTLTIANNTYVEVENNVTVESTINVNERGSFKQNNNAGDVTVTTSGSVLVRKETAPMNNWYEYTYWSSPVAGATIGNALADATPSRRFWFDAQNYLDSFAETGNNNAADPGQDDIDDAAPWDWTLAAATDVMEVGRGYASTHRSNIFAQFPCSNGTNCRFVYTFEGPFNNGIYNVPLYRNDAELNDNNWNFIGNPYPSAISADAFLAANTLIDLNVPTPSRIDGAIYLWSQNTMPSGTNNGNENLNFAQADYAIINGTAQSAGGDGVLPARFIPSGQGFFVSLSDAAPTTLVSGTIRRADVVFNNQMRVTGNNTQFFRTANELQPNKLWVNLTSDNGVFNQVVIGYVNGATDANDGMYYDAPRNLSTDANSILYSLIPDSDKKFAIQGKDPNSLSLDEVIPLGFYTSINQATIYKLSIAQFEGDFFTNQTVYVKDNLLNLYHDLSAADYPFTSETGEFNERFEIVFKPLTLGIGDIDVQPNDVSIIELTNGQVKFTIGHNLTIKSVEIYDMLGRQLYNLPGSNAIEIYNLANLSQAAYVAKVTLSNGQTVTKRAVKRQ